MAAEQINATAANCAQAERLAQLDALLAGDDIDAAIDAGLMTFVQCGSTCCADSARVLAVQQQLQHAWAARDRHRARAERLQRRAAERDARRKPVITESTKPSLPPAAAAILARAKAKAANRSGNHDPT